MGVFALTDGRAGQGPAGLGAGAAAAGAAQAWLVGAVTGLLVGWPLLYAAMVHGPAVLFGQFTSDAYHYLAIARKAAESGFYTYDGVSATNGFHPLWQYLLRAVFVLFELKTHHAQAVAAVLCAALAGVTGAVLASTALVGLTGSRALGLLIVPGVYYLVVGVHARTLPIWSAFDGMESCLSVLFGGVFFFVLSHWLAASRPGPLALIGMSRALGLVLPLLILSRLDDVFILAAFALALSLLAVPLHDRLRAAAWLLGPSVAVICVYLIYNQLTVGAAMPLSGATKSGFVGLQTLYLSAAVHFAPILDLKGALTGVPADGNIVFANSFRFMNLVYAAMFGVLAALTVYRYGQHRRDAVVWFALAIYLVLKTGYNFLNVHPWHQSAWYYLFATLCISVMGGVALRAPWASLRRFGVLQGGFVVGYVGIALLASSQHYASVVYGDRDRPELVFWQRKTDIAEALARAGVTGLINVDDGIAAFLLDMPNMHGFAFAADVLSHRAEREGRMLSLAHQRGINAIAGFGYMTSEHPPASDVEIKKFLASSLAARSIGADLERFTFTLAYYDRALKLPFFRFEPAAR